MPQGSLSWGGVGNPSPHNTNLDNRQLILASKQLVRQLLHRLHGHHVMRHGRLPPGTAAWADEGGAAWDPRRRPAGARGRVGQSVLRVVLRGDAGMTASWGASAGVSLGISEGAPLV